jgi:glycosyltransferase involved in cell wall biosynthesis
VNWSLVSERPLRVLRVYHEGRDPGHRERERALVRAGVEVTLAVPDVWPGPGGEKRLRGEEFRIVELPVSRAGDVNRHHYPAKAELDRVIGDVSPDLLDVHEEPFSLAARGWLAAAPKSLPVVLYTAQNIDKRFPPPFSRYEQLALRRAAGLYPCSRQAAAVARGKGFAGLVEVLPFGLDDALFTPGSQRVEDGEIVLAFCGRFVPEKGLIDCVRVLARLNQIRPARLLVRGAGTDEEPARKLAAQLGVGDRLEIRGWASGEELAVVYRSAHVVLVPSRPTATWVEQFGRVIVEAQASGAVVAGYDTGTIREVGGDAALLVAPGDVAGLSRVLLALLADPADWERRRALGLEASRSRTWTRVAEREVEFYRRVLEASGARIRLPRSPGARRQAARAEFGSTAPTAAGVRPFALPHLRDGGLAAHALASTIDVVAEAAARLPTRRYPSD